MGIKGEDTKEKILDVAQRLVLQKGFSGTSIDEILQEAELTKGGFFYHFRGKADLARQLLVRYLAQDNQFFSDLFQRAERLSEDPLQQMLIFLNLYAEAMRDLPGVHPGCLVASFTYESQLFDPEIRQLTQQGVVHWRAMFAERFERIVACNPMAIEVAPVELADMLSAITEGGITLSRMLVDPEVLVQQILQFRTYVRLLFGASPLHS